MITHRVGNIIQNAIKYNNGYGNVFISVSYVAEFIAI